MSSPIYRHTNRLLFALLACVLLAGCSSIAARLNPAPTSSQAAVPTNPAVQAQVTSATATLAAATSTSPAATGEAAAGGTGVVNTALLRIRRGPSTAQPILANVKQGDQLTILGRNTAGDWLNVRLPDGVTGWAAAQYVTVNGLGSSQALSSAVSATAAPTSAPVATRKGPPTGAEIAHLVKVIDGDTIDVWLDGVTERVRYVGVDTPELSQPGYKAATEANRALLGTGTLYLLRDISDRDQTASHRLLRYVYLPDGTMVQRELVAQGWAQPAEYPPDTFYAKEFRQLAVQAAQRKVGFWSPKPPADGAMPYGLTTNVATLRKSPGPGFPASATLSKDTPLTVYGRTAEGDWLQIRAPTRAGGWVSTGFVRLNVPIEQVPVVGESAATPTP